MENNNLNPEEEKKIVHDIDIEQNNFDAHKFMIDNKTILGKLKDDEDD